MTTPTTVSRLLPEHRKMLIEESGVPEDIVGERGYYSATTKAEIRGLGFAPKQCLAPALVIPIWNVHGELASYSIRPNQPRVFENGKLAKYEHPAGSHMVLDVHPRCQTHLKDPAVPLYVTEGAKKGDALAAHGLCAIALSGVWNWRGSNDQGGKLALADWDGVALNERQVLIVFDSDVARKLSVAQAMERLKGFLETRKAKVQIVYLPEAEDGAKQGVDDYFAAGGTPEDLLKLASPKVIFPEQEDPDAIPVVVVTERDVPDVAEETWEAITAWNETNKALYQRENQLILLRRNDLGQAYLSMCGNEDMAHLAQRAASFHKALPPSRGGGTAPVTIPKPIVEDLLASWSPPVPRIRGIVQSPVFAADGSLRTDDGYDDGSKLFISLRGLQVPVVPAKPDVRDVEQARALILEDWLDDFPFDRRSSQPHAVAAALTPLVRELIAGPTPLFAVDAPTQGTGKGLLVHTIATVVTGAPAPVMTEVSGDEERKRITALLSEAHPIILIDNVKRRLDSSNLAAVLTSETWSDRRLGQTETIVVPNRALWVATGNNLEIDGELARRTVTVRLDSRLDRPFERHDFRHPNLLEWIGDNRDELLWALLVLAQHWLAQGRPPWNGQPLGSFEKWSRVVGGILQAAGIEGFLEDREHIYRVADSETEDWRSFVSAWWETFAERPVKAGDLAEIVRAEDLLPRLTASSRGDLTLQQIKTRLGKAISSRRDRRIGDLFIRVAGKDSHQKSTLYVLEPAEDGTPLEQPSADPPQGFRADLNTNAEVAEVAEDDPLLRAREDHASSSDRRVDRVYGEAGNQPPHPPQPPPLNTNEGSDPAEGGSREALILRSEPPPRLCALCKLGIGVMPVGDYCKSCHEWRQERAEA